MSEVERVLRRTNFRQAALLAVPWILLQFGFSGVLLLPLGAVGIWIFAGVLALGVVALMFLYLRSSAELGNLMIRQQDADLEYYGIFTWFRQWGDQLELVRKDCPGYLNMLRLNYAALPVALLAFVLEFWIAALGLLLVWLFTGILVRAAMARGVWRQDVSVLRSTGWRFLLLLILAVGSWGAMLVEASRSERMYRVALEQMQENGVALSVTELQKRYHWDGANGALSVKALEEVPEIPKTIQRIANARRVENASAEHYTELEEYAFAHVDFLQRITDIGRVPTARLGYEFEKGRDGAGGLRELIKRYRQLARWESVRMIASAVTGNERQFIEGYLVLGNLRRQLNQEPTLGLLLTAQSPERTRLRLLERYVNEFGIYAEQNREMLARELTLTERELREAASAALRGEVSLTVFTDFQLPGRIAPDVGFRRLFPALTANDYRWRAACLEGMGHYLAAVDGRLLPSEAAARIASAGMSNDLILSDWAGGIQRHCGLLRSVRAARIGLAVNRYERARGMFPEMLSQLPGLAAEDLVDPETGAPMRYSASGFQVKVTDVVTGERYEREFTGVEIGDSAGFRLYR